jgi:hypothetical protein
MSEDLAAETHGLSSVVGPYIKLSQKLNALPSVIEPLTVGEQEPGRCPTGRLGVSYSIAK